MKNQLVAGMVLGAGGVLIALVAFLVGLGWQSGSPAKGDPPPIPPGGSADKDKVPNPPPAPKAVAAPDRVRQNLRPGKTYVTHTKGVLNVRATDKAWGL